MPSPPVSKSSGDAKLTIMRIKIFSCHHQAPAESLMTSLFATLVSGEKSDPNGRFLGDLDGPNIATQNEHSELRLHYHV